MSPRAVRQMLWGACLAAAVLGPANPALAEVSALFVGIGNYQHGVRNAAPDQIAILDGPAQDVERIRAALNTAYGFGFDEASPAGDDCPDPASLGEAFQQARSVTLIDHCATRAAILAGLRGLIDNAHQGDTVILYFAGHGSLIPAQLTNDPDSQRSHSSFLSWDARGDDPAVSEILDVEFGEWRVAATTKGVNFVFIADYCSSGTGTRELGAAGRARSAPPGQARSVARAKPVTPGTGRSLLLAAARDGEEAFEEPIAAPAGQVRYGGVFTTALVTAMARNRGASLLDLIGAIRTDPLLLRRPTQHPQAEGDLTYALTGEGLAPPSRPGAALDARYTGGVLSLPRDGDFAGMTPDSTIALFASATAATTAGSPPLLKARVAEVGAYATRLEPIGSIPPNLPAELWAREEVHRAAPVKVQLDGLLGLPQSQAERDSVLAALARPAAAAQQPLATLGEPAPVMLGLQGACGTVELRDRALNRIADLGKPLSPSGGPAPEFRARLAAALTRVARVEQVLSRSPGPVGRIGLCLDQELAADCAASPGDRAVPEFLPRQKMDILLTNSDTQARYMYLLALDEDMTMRLVLPAAGGVDNRMEAATAIRAQVMLGDGGHRCRYIAIATEQRLSTASLLPPAAGPGQCGGSIENVSSLRGSIGEVEAVDGPSPQLAARAWSMAVAEIRIRGFLSDDDQCAD